MAQILWDDLYICSDCLAYAANGTESEDCIQADLTMAGVESFAPGQLVAAGGEDDEGIFLSVPCDCCHSPESGWRYKAAVLGN